MKKSLYTSQALNVFLFIFFCGCISFANGYTCEALFKDSNLDLVSTPKRRSAKPIDKVRYFKDIAWLMKAILPEIRHELSKINNNLGSDIEIAQTKSFLNRVIAHELGYLDGIKPLENTVIYGSTNVPLYTLVTQVFLSGSFSKNVWFRTPQATREIYIKIFQLFKDYLPREYTDHIHLITDPSDLAYDQFNRIYVMGQNRSGQKSLRAPSDLVILTGSPETARTMIERNMRNLRRVLKDYPQQKQLFLGFLAGVNPAVILPSARENMATIVEKITFPFLVNGGQDCMNSDVIFAHKNVESKFTQALMAKMKTLKLTTNTDSEAGLTPLTMTKSFSKLIGYREKYKQYLLNPEATIDETTKQVSPHIFVIPFNEFAGLDVQEHFAPFVTIVRYDNSEQLKAASLDPRLQKKAMSALIYGAERMTPDVNEALQIFKQAQHSVLLNTHLYEEFEMNMPFGGSGVDTSISALVQAKENGDVELVAHSRPLLISHEADAVFSKTSGPFNSLKTSHDNMYTLHEREQFEIARAKILSTINKFRYPMSSLEKQSFESRVYVYVRDYLGRVQAQLPRGAVIMNYGESVSDITSFSSSAKQIAKEFSLWFYQAQEKNRSASFADPAIQNFLKNQNHSNATSFVLQLLFNPSKLQMQQRSHAP